MSLGQNVCPFWIAELICLVAGGTLMQRAGTSSSFLSQKGPTAFIRGFSAPNPYSRGAPVSGCAWQTVCSAHSCLVPSPGGIQPIADLAGSVRWPLLCFCSGAGTRRGLHAPWSSAGSGNGCTDPVPHQGWRKGTELPSAAIAEGWRAAQALHLALLPTHVQEFSCGSEIHPSSSRAAPRAYTCFVLL